MKRYNKIMAVVFSLLLVFLMIPALPQTAYADDSPAVQKADPKAGYESQIHAVRPDREARILERVIQRPETTPAGMYKSPVAFGSVGFSADTPAAATYLSAWVIDANDAYPDPSAYDCTWYYEEGDGWTKIDELPSTTGDHAIIVPAYARGSRIKVVAVPKDASQYSGTATGITEKVISSRLDEVQIFPLGTGYFVGNELEAYAIYKAEGKDHYIDDGYIHYDYYVGEGNSWTQIPEGDYNSSTFIPFEAEGKFIKVIAYTMAEQDDVMGGPLTVTSKERCWIFPIADNFHDETLPSGWATINHDDDIYCWESMVGSGELSLSGYDGECIGSASWVSEDGALHPDNWLISPSFYVPKYANLEYYVTGTYYQDCAEHYGVYISTGVGLDLLDFKELKTETLDDYDKYQKRVINLSEYAGKNVHIAFRHFDCTDQYYLNLDGVSINSPMVRVAGNNRYDTSIDIANRYMSVKGLNKLPLIFVSTGDAFPDALSGSSISIAYDAPVLLISPKQEGSQLKALNYIENHLANSGGVVLLGGEQAVPKTFEDKLKDMAADSASPVGFVDRVSGTDRYKTNLEILDIVYGKTGSEYLLVCDGTNYADAATASATGVPVMLVGKTGLTEDQIAFLKKGIVKYIYIIGGPSAVSEEVEAQLAPYDHYSKPFRIAGKNRAETAVEVAKFFVSEYSTTKVVFAYGGNYPDCIAGGLLANCVGAPILYGDSKAPKSYVDADTPFFNSNKSISKAYVLGGPGLISNDFVMDLMEINFVG